MLMYLFLVGGPTFGALFYGWQAWDRAHWWRPAEAVTIGSDYSEAERLDDRKPFASLRPRPFTDARSGRYTKVRIDYADAAGRHHQATITRVITRGKTVMPAMRVFYDTRDPGRVNLFGPKGAAFWCAVWTAVLINVLWHLPQIATLPGQYGAPGSRRPATAKSAR